MGVFRRRSWPREIWLYVSCLPTTRQMRFSPTPSYRRKGDCPFRRRSTRVSPPPSLSVRPEGTFLSDWITCKNFQCKAGPPARNPSASVRGRLWGLTLRSCIMGGDGDFSVIMLEKLSLPGYCCRMLPGVLGSLTGWVFFSCPAVPLSGVSNWLALAHCTLVCPTELYRRVVLGALQLSHCSPCGLGSLSAGRSLSLWLRKDH